MTKLDFGYRGQRLAAAASEVFAALLKARRDRGDVQELLLEQQGLCALCGTPIEAATAEADHVATPRAWRAGSVATSTRPTPARLGCRRWSAGWRSAIPTGSVRAWTSSAAAKMPSPTHPFPCRSSVRWTTSGPPRKDASRT